MSSHSSSYRILVVLVLVVVSLVTPVFTLQLHVRMADVKNIYCVRLNCDCTWTVECIKDVLPIILLLPPVSQENGHNFFKTMWGRETT